MEARIKELEDKVERQSEKYKELEKQFNEFISNKEEQDEAAAFIRYDKQQGITSGGCVNYYGIGYGKNGFHGVVTDRKKMELLTIGTSNCRHEKFHTQEDAAAYVDWVQSDINKTTGEPLDSKKWWIVTNNIQKKISIHSTGKDANNTANGIPGTIVTKFNDRVDLNWHLKEFSSECTISDQNQEENTEEEYE